MASALKRYRFRGQGFEDSRLLYLYKGRRVRPLASEPRAEVFRDDKIYMFKKLKSAIRQSLKKECRQRRSSVKYMQWAYGFENGANSPPSEAVARLIEMGVPMLPGVVSPSRHPALKAYAVVVEATKPCDGQASFSPYMIGLWR